MLPDLSKIHDDTTDDGVGSCFLHHVLNDASVAKGKDHMQHVIQADQVRNNQWVTGISSLSMRTAKRVPWRYSRHAPFAVAGDADDR